MGWRDGEVRGPPERAPLVIGTPGPGAAALAAPSWEGEGSVGWLCVGFGAFTRVIQLSEVWGEPCPRSAEERCLAGSDPRRLLFIVFLGSASHLRVELSCRGGWFPMLVWARIKLDTQSLYPA